MDKKLYEAQIRNGDTVMRADADNHAVGLLVPRPDSFANVQNLPWILNRGIEAELIATSWPRSSRIHSWATEVLTRV